MQTNHTTTPTNFNLPDGCSINDIDPIPEREESPYAPDESEPREDFGD